jgi:hypothetical protein
MMNMIVEVKLSFNNYSHIFYGIGPEYRGLTGVVTKEHYISVPEDRHKSSFTIFSFIQLAVNRPCTDLMSDCSRRQSSEDLMEGKTLM